MSRNAAITASMWSCVSPPQPAFRGGVVFHSRQGSWFRGVPVWVVCIARAMEGAKLETA
jgi:hypothetical protein